MNWKRHQLCFTTAWPATRIHLSCSNKKKLFGGKTDVLYVLCPMFSLSSAAGNLTDEPQPQHSEIHCQMFCHLVTNIKVKILCLQDHNTIYKTKQKWTMQCNVYKKSKINAGFFSTVERWLSGVYNLQECSSLTLWIASIALGQGIEWIRVVLMDIHGLEAGVSDHSWLWVQQSAVEMWCDLKWWSSSQVNTHPLLMGKRCVCWPEHQYQHQYFDLLHSLGPV